MHTDVFIIFSPFPVNIAFEITINNDFASLVTPGLSSKLTRNQCFRSYWMRYSKGFPARFW